MATRTFGTMAVDWEQRIDFDRLRRERLARVKELLAKSEMGSVLCFDMNNVRVHHRDAHRHVGPGQDQPFHAPATGRRADPLGLRIGRPASSAELSVVGRALARGHSA